MIFTLKITNLHTSVKNVLELWFLISAHCLTKLYICTKFHNNTSLSTYDSKQKFKKGHNAIKQVGREMFLILCT